MPYKEMTSNGVLFRAKALIVCNIFFMQNIR